MRSQHRHALISLAAPLSPTWCDGTESKKAERVGDRRENQLQSQNVIQTLMQCRYSETIRPQTTIDPSQPCFLCRIPYLKCDDYTL